MYSTEVRFTMTHDDVNLGEGIEFENSCECTVFDGFSTVFDDGENDFFKDGEEYELTAEQEDKYYQAVLEKAEREADEDISDFKQRDYEKAIGRHWE